jgi:flagellar assembly protein FliH
MEVQTVHLALGIARKIVQRELTMDPDLVAALASVALKRVQGHQSIALRVSRHDFGRVRVVVGNVNPAVTVKDDATLERGDFVIETGQTFLDGRISTQIDTIGKALFDE